MENLLNCKGRKFRAIIKEITTEGRIQVEDGKVFLCQNEINGADAKDKLGYNYSWSADRGSAEDLARKNIHDFQLIPITPEEIEAYKEWQVGDRIINGMAPTNVCEVIFRSGELVVFKYPNGMASDNYTCDELHRNDYRLVPPEQDAPEEEKPSARELTMDEIAEKFGLPVDRIRVKKD